MHKLIDIIAYILLHTPNPDILSKYRVTKMVYLADWCSCVNRGYQMSNIKWFFDNYGPFVWDVYNTVENNPNIFSISYDRTYYGETKMLFSMKDISYCPNLSNTSRSLLDFIISQTCNLPTSEFTRLVYNTYPILTTKRYHFLNLPQKAFEYTHNKIN